MRMRKGMCRLQLTANEERVEKIRGHLKALGLPRTQFSVLVDRMLMGMEKQLALAVSREKQGQQLTMADVMEVAAHLIRDEENKNAQGDSDP